MRIALIAPRPVFAVDRVHVYIEAIYSGHEFALFGTCVDSWSAGRGFHRGKVSTGSFCITAETGPPSLGDDSNRHSECRNGATPPPERGACSIVY